MSHVQKMFRENASSLDVYNVVTSSKRLVMYTGFMPFKQTQIILDPYSMLVDKNSRRCGWTMTSLPALSPRIIPRWRFTQNTKHITTLQIPPKKAFPFPY